MTGYEEETKNAIATAEVLNTGCEAVDNVNNRMRKAQRGEPSQPQAQP